MEAQRKGKVRKGKVRKKGLTLLDLLQNELCCERNDGEYLDGRFGSCKRKGRRRKEARKRDLAQMHVAGGNEELNEL